MRELLLTVSSGTGPVEVRRFVRLLADALRVEVSRRGLRVEAVVAHGAADAPSSVDLALCGNAGAVDALVGTHALVLRSERRGKRDRKRWYAGVTCVVRELAVSSELDLRDVSFETCRAGGAGGQHVNKTESAVRAVHRPSGTSVRVESERSQHQNKRRAVELLSRALAEQSAARTADARSARRGRSLRVERGAPVVTWCVEERGELVRAHAVGGRDAQ